MLKYVLSILLFFFLNILLSQGMMHRIISDVDGLPSNTIYSILQKQDGYLWIGTANGLVRYDGQNFNTFKSPQLKDNEILGVLEDGYGTVWGINLSGQIFSVKKNLEGINLLPFQEGEPFTTFTIDGQNKLISLSKNGGGARGCNVFFYDLSEYNQLKQSVKITNEHVYCRRVEGLMGNVIIDRNKLFLLNDTTKVLRASSDWQLLQEYLIYNEKDTVLLEKGLLSWYTNKQAIMKNKPFPFERAAINRTFIDNDELFIATQHGVFVFLAENNYEGHQYFSDKTINTIAKDREGNLLLGTANSGLIVIKNSDLSYFSKENSKLNNDLIYKIYPHADRAIYVFQSNRFLTVIQKNGLASTFQTNINGAVRAVAQLDADWLLIASDDISIFNTKTRAEKIINDNISIKNLLEYGDYIYFSGTYGIFRVHKTELFSANQFSIKNRILDKNRNEFIKERTYDLFFDADGTLWIATTKGLFVYVEEAFEKYPLEENISTISGDDLGTIYIGTSNKGVFSIKQQVITDTLNETSNLPSNTINKIFQAVGATWIQTNVGLSKLVNGHLLNYDQHDGILTREINDATIFDNKVWIATRLGLFTFPIDYVPRNDLPPIIYLDKVNHKSKVLDLKNRKELAPHENDLTFHFNGINFSNTDKTQYAYQLEGYESARRITTKRAINYPNLPAGSYTFIVQAINEDKVESLPEKISFSIIPPIYQRWWFYPTVWVISFCVLFVLWQTRTKRKEKALMLNNKLIRLQQQSLQTQMNPHFIFNSMNTIQHYINANDKKSANIYLSKFAKLIRLIFEYSKRDKIDIEDEIAFIHLYLELEKKRFGDKVNVEFMIEDSIRNCQYEIHIPPLLLQPIIENAFKHGLFHKAQKGVLKIHIDYADNYLVCIIEDDGVGRERVNQLKNRTSVKHRSSGLETIQKRLNLLQKDAQVPTLLLQVIDLKDSEGKGIGTKFIVKIPVV